MLSFSKVSKHPVLNLVKGFPGFPEALLYNNNNKM